MSPSVCPAVCCSLCLSDSQSFWRYVNYPAYAGPFPCSTSVRLSVSLSLCSCIRTCICVHPCRQTTYGNTTAPLPLILSLLTLYAHRFSFFFYLNATMCAFIYILQSLCPPPHYCSYLNINSVHKQNIVSQKCQRNTQKCFCFRATALHL